ncbi:MAG: hypothetical protein WKF37_14115 [Bryobacteraceae bacterium]
MGHLNIIDEKLGTEVAEELGMQGEAAKITPAVNPIDLRPSPALRLYGKYEPTLKGRKVGVLVAAGFDLQLKNALVAAIEKEEATAVVIALRVGGVNDSSAGKHGADAALSGSPSVFFDAVTILAGSAGDASLAANPDAVSFLMDANRHLKVIGLSGVPSLTVKAHVGSEAGVIDLVESNAVASFIELARNGKVWERESASRGV